MTFSFRFESHKKKLKAGEKCEISMKVKNKGTGKIQRLTVTYQGPKRQYYDVPAEI